MRKIVRIKVSYDTDDMSYGDLEQAIEELPIDDVELLEEYED